SEKSDTHPRWSPDGSSLAFLSSREESSQIYLMSLKGGEPQKISDLPTGIDGFIWAPDGEGFVAATEMLPAVETPQESMDLLENQQKEEGSGRVIDALLYRHWNVWREGKFSRLVLLNRQGEFVRSLTPGEYNTPPISLGSEHDYQISPDGESLAFVQNRDSIVAISTNNDVFVKPLKGGDEKQISSGGGNDNGPRFSPDGRYLAYLSMERAGYEADQQELMIYDRKSGSEKNLTESLDRSVSDYVWSPDAKKIYFFVPHYGWHRLYQADVKKGELTLLLDNQFINAIDISPDGKYLVLARQAVNQPTELYRFDINSKKLTQSTFTNKELLSQLEMNPLENFWFQGANEDSIHLMMVKPPDFDENRKYPVICLIHGGPQGGWGDDFHYRWNAEMFAAPGYVVIMINFHGSHGYGRAFKDAVSKDWGGAPFEDIMKGTRWALQQFSFMDKERVGAAGASYGGFMINWIEGHNPDKLFKCLVSHDGVFEQRSMFGATEELWFPAWEFNGYPWTTGNLYEKWNPANFVENFNTPMLIIHGE
ncbi:MAG: S9 family peptidase, partial [Calditrichia bacterium]